MITYESICEKLGFDFTKWKSNAVDEDDSKESPFAILTMDELEFAVEYLKKHSLKSVKAN